MPALAAALAVVAALRVPGPLSPKIASYAIEARLDTEAKTVGGHEKITWKNTQAGPARELVFHLYMNAFKNQASTFLEESHGAHRGHELDEHGWGSIDVSKISVGGQDLTAGWKVDDTLATLQLPQPIASAATATIEVDWSAKLPLVFARTGYRDEYFAIAQWFPKVGVFECASADSCRWRAHQHHLNSEFFADYGDYDVKFDLPSRFVVGATGVPVGETAAGDRKTLTYHAEDVLDFALAAYPDFSAHTDKLVDPFGEVELILLEVPGRESNAARHLASAKSALAEYERRLGAYPYSRLTIVDVPQNAIGAGGMEYPTLFFTAGSPLPSGIHFAEAVTAHELGHQYFMHLVASDEVEEAWLDEGFTETATEWALRKQFGEPREVVDLLGRTLSATANDRGRVRNVPRTDPIATVSFRFASNGGYGATTYGRTEITLRTVENLIGADHFEAGMRRYYETQRFHHPRKADFVREFDAGAGTDLSWFWPSALDGSGDLDYEVLSVEDRPDREPAGLFDREGKRIEVPLPKPSEAGPRRSEAVIYRRGEMIFPVTIRASFGDGSAIDETWDGGRDGARWRRFQWKTSSPLVSVQIDPDGKVPLDLRRWNDGLRVKPEPAPRRRVAGGFFEALSSLLSLVGF